MKKFIYLYLSFLLLIIFSSCEKVVEIDLNEDNPRLVIEGMVTNQPGPYTVQITRSGSFYGSTRDFERIIGAEVRIYDNTGQAENLIEEEPGLYKTINLQGIEGNTYFLEVRYDGETYTASSAMPQKVSIDSLTWEKREEQVFFASDKYIRMYFTDPANIRNFYYLKTRTKGLPVEPMGSFTVFNDQLFNGQNVSDDIGYYNFMEGDTVIVELHSIDRQAFEYYNNLNSILNNTGGNPFQGAPQNPTTNISGPALGFFGAYALSADSIILE